MKTHPLISSIPVLFMGLISGCDLINPAEPVPGYIHVEKFSINHVPALGTDSNKISDVYVYIDSKFQGAYELPAEFPIIETGSHSMIFYAGIIINGISNTRMLYPFYDGDVHMVNLAPGKITAVTPEISYLDDVVCEWCEDFENAGLTLEQTASSDTGIIFIGSPSNFEGNKSGAVFLDDAHPFFEIQTDTTYELPIAGVPVFLEMNYKCNNSFSVGLFAYTSSIPDQVAVITINPKTTWNKIYIELTPTIGNYFNAAYFRVFIGAQRDEGVTNAEFYFDNFKLLHL